MPDPHPNVKRAAEAIVDHLAHGLVHVNGKPCVHVSDIASIIEHHTHYSEVVEALRKAHAVIAMVVEPEVISKTTVLHAWARANEIERSTRNLLTTIEKEGRTP